MKNYRKKINDLLALQRVTSKQLKAAEVDVVSLRETVIHLEQAQTVFQSASKLLYDNLSIQLGRIITEGLSLVFPETAYTFTIEFVERRGTIEADLFLEDSEGHRYHPTDAVGGGISDFISILLRITFIVLSKYENVLIADEPLRFIDRERIGLATAFVKQVCADFEMQLIIITHIPEVIEHADMVYKVSQLNRVSTIKKIR